MAKVSTELIYHTETIMKIPFIFVLQKLMKIILFLLIFSLLIDLGSWVLYHKSEYLQKNTNRKILRGTMEEKVTKNIRAKDKPLILVWNGYQEDDSLYRTIFKRMTSGSCSYTCSFTRNKTRQNESSVILFHLPNLHWEGYNYPPYRDPTIPWVLMTYESANSVRERSSNWGRYPAITGKHMNNVFNRTMTLRTDSDIVVRHGFVQKRETPLSEEKLSELYGKESVRDFSNLTQETFESGNQPSPIVWFVSHCKDYNGRMKYVHLLQNYIGVDIYGECGPYQCGQTRSMGHDYRIKEDPCFKMVNKKYKFYLSFENAICKDYVTEKMFNALKLNTIPVVFGGANYSQILPPGSYIDALDFPDPKGLYKPYNNVIITFCS